MKVPSPVEIVEVALRDGLQNEKNLISVADKIEFAQRLANAGLRRLEIASFVRADRIPQMEGSLEVVNGCFAARANGQIPQTVEFSALVPNEFGLREAIKTPLREVAVFAACSETFSQKNINCSIEESFARFNPVFEQAHAKGLRVRGYLSVCFGCPYEGTVPVDRVVQLAERLAHLGAFEISIGDTIGVATPDQVEAFLDKLKAQVPLAKVAGHFHDTRRTALANIWASYKMGVHVFDSSFGGLGGCPYAPGASGNVATEDVLMLFSRVRPEFLLIRKKLREIYPWADARLGKKYSHDAV